MSPLDPARAQCERACFSRKTFIDGSLMRERRTDQAADEHRAKRTAAKAETAPDEDQGEEVEETADDGAAEDAVEPPAPTRWELDTGEGAPRTLSARKLVRMIEAGRLVKGRVREQGKSRWWAVQKHPQFAALFGDPAPAAPKADRSRRSWWTVGVLAAVIVVAIIAQVMRRSEKKTLEDDQLCTNNLATAREQIAASKFDDARPYVNAAQVACGTARAADFAAVRDEFNTTLDAQRKAEREAQIDANTAQVKEHRDGAARVWNAYDNLPKGKKTKLDLFAAMLEAKSHEQGLPSALVPYITRYNAKEQRLRMAPLINPESRAEGTRAEILVPSPDRAKCVIWGSGWSKEVESLQSIGFEKIRCAESSYKSHLTAEMVVEPERVWDVSKP
ncbi:MAG: hypothetical protein U0359_41795 [Byssovorax sp.]